MKNVDAPLVQNVLLIHISSIVFTAYGKLRFK